MLARLRGMMGDSAGVRPDRFLLAAMAALTLWVLLTFAARISVGEPWLLPHLLFMHQDFPALLGAIAAMVLAAPFVKARGAGTGESWIDRPDTRLLLFAVAAFCIWSWAGHYLVFHDYAMSRDEEVAEFAAAYMRDGLIARPIPPELAEYRRAIMPEFFSPFGADRYWTAAYLPVNSALRAAADWLFGDYNLAPALLLAAGLLALWRVSLRLFPGRPDAVWVTMLLAMTSAQLSVTAMTPYAMTAHFAFNMVWLALFLRGDALGHVAAGIVAVVAGGIHQWHFPLIFLAPFLLYLLLARRWGALLFHAAVCAVIVIIWAKLWPAYLHGHLGPPADTVPAAGVAAKFGSLFLRIFAKWEPLFNLSRFIAWNNILMVPLAVLGVAAIPWRDALKGNSIVLPLAAGCVLSALLALYQGYGWGFRYMHGFIGPFCVLAGFGWIRLRMGSHRLLYIMIVAGLGAMAFLTMRAGEYSAPYARGYHYIESLDADVVLVDPRGAMFVTDLIRTRHGEIGRPLVMNLARLSPEAINHICATKRTLIVNRTAYRRFGIILARMRPDAVREVTQRLKNAGCGAIVVPSWR